MLVFTALNVNIHPLSVLWISMFVLLIVSLPISLGGIGVRETGFAWLLSIYGIEPEKGMLVGGMISIQFLLNVCLGAVMNIFEKK